MFVPGACLDVPIADIAGLCNIPAMSRISFYSAIDFRYNNNAPFEEVSLGQQSPKKILGRDILTKSYLIL